ncbi:MAG: 2-oxoglutarate dehydrogenase E1 component, partial [Sediminibacterium sp.]|nr:2-oxoglutarate dehydrogenase E1 component [Sediminibacterium sp.]
MKDFSYITNAHPQFIESLYKSFLEDPNQIDIEYKKFFEGFDYAINSNITNSNNPVFTNSTIAQSNILDEIKVYRLILGYRNKGHLLAHTNPIRERIDRNAELNLSNFDLSENHLNQRFTISNIIGLQNATLQEILDKLNKVYGGSIGIEYKYISNQNIVNWIKNEVEENFSNPLLFEQRKRIIEKLNQAVLFEKFLHIKYIGQKRFSLEGGETTIPALDAIIQTAGNLGVEEVVLGMAHRGRLNVLANILGKTYQNIFNEFEGNVISDQTMGSGDVKYHLGFSSEIVLENNKSIHVKLMPNPSHLEAVNPVVLGFSRAKADILYHSNFEKILPILIHGDSSIAGQGIVYETLQMSNLDGYYTGGTIHFVINNQIGFTTDFADARSANYCTSLAAMVQAPVLHVNGDDIEAVIKCVEFATNYRQKFKKDVFIDMVCYRKHGHNEGDDPKYTQPKLYEIIENHKNPREIYTEYLQSHGEPEIAALGKQMENQFWKDLQERLDEVKQHPLPYTYQQPELVWKTMQKLHEQDLSIPIKTNISKENLLLIFDKLMHPPTDFKPLKKIEKLLEDKINLLQNEQKIDWATAELMAYSAIILEGKTVRLSGQDVQRGTFSHRHAVIHNKDTNEEYNRLSNLIENTNSFKIYNSLLSEYAVLGFEYGYAMANPNALVIWEAQFGDFCNGSQTIIDQFIMAGEQKWLRQNGVVLLLPHGFEGQGPEHSSARIERFLQLAAENNCIITNVTEAANLFHLLRRQITWNFRKPLINFSPKAYLRNPQTYSNINDFIDKNFCPVLDDQTIEDTEKINKVLLCSGKIYFELNEKRIQEKGINMAIIRLEQLYPLPLNEL